MIAQNREWSSTAVTTLHSMPSAKKTVPDDVDLPQRCRFTTAPSASGVPSAGRCGANSHQKSLLGRPLMHRSRNLCRRQRRPETPLP
jgi:hypothetical protein